MIQKTTIPWESYGLTLKTGEADSSLDWHFEVINLETLCDFGENTPKTGISVRCPVSLCVEQGTLGIAGDSLWQKYIRLENDHLIFELPLETMPEASILILPPGFHGPGPVGEAFGVKTIVYDKPASSVYLVCPLTTHSFTLEAYTPLATLVPTRIPMNERSPFIQAARAAGGNPEPEEYPLSVSGMKDFTLRVWRLHPNMGVGIYKASKDLNGDCPQAALKWCGPFTHANQCGFWLTPALDIDIMWYGGRSFDYKMITPYTDEDGPWLQKFQTPEDKYEIHPRHKIDFGRVLDPVVSIWTGCIFQTPPGWSLQIRSPINTAPNTVFKIQEGILETDWMPYDIWSNLQFLQPDKWVRLRRDEYWKPFAQLVPIRREAYDRPWDIEERRLERVSPEGKDMFDRWIDYNYKKWLAKGEKDSLTYHRERTQTLKTPREESKEKEDDA